MVGKPGVLTKKKKKAKKATKQNLLKQISSECKRYWNLEDLIESFLLYISGALIAAPPPPPEVYLPKKSHIMEYKIAG